MPKFARAICTLPHDNGLPEDAAVNVWHFEGDDSQTWEEDADDLAGRLHTFYLAIDQYLSALVSSTLIVDIYNLADPTPRVPVYSETWTDLVPATTALPSEVALCSSFQATQESGVNQARRRGRVYIGPLGANTTDAGVLAGRPLASFITAVAAATDALAVGPDPGDFRLAVFSPTILAAGGSLADAFSDVDNGWVDNTWDTQRRRGISATSRTTWVA